MSANQVTINKHVNDGLLGIKRRAVRSTEKHRRIYGEIWDQVSADRRISLPTNFGNQKALREPYNLAATQSNLEGLKGFDLNRLRMARRGGQTRFSAMYVPKSEIINYC
jgi:hypothetical protein